MSGGHLQTNADDVARRLRQRGGRASLQAAKAVQEFTTLLQTRVMAAASGRPGPRAITGNYRRSISRHVRLTRVLFIGTVGTNAPQAWRLEKGFYGRDSAGRTYRQPPYAHFGPATRVTRPEFRQAMRAIGWGR